MAFVKCFDVVTMVTDEATAQFGPSFRENKERKQILELYCGVMDKLAEEFGGESFEVEVDEIKMTIAVRMECEDIIIQSHDHLFYKLAMHALSVRFSHVNSNAMAIEFVFPSIWEKAF